MPNDQPGKPTFRLWRRIAGLAGVSIILVVTIFAAAILFREDLAHAVIQNRLGAVGIEDAVFRVDEVTTKSVVIAGFSAGKAVSFNRLTVSFTIDDLLRGRVARVDLAGLQLDMTEPGPWAQFQRGRSDSAVLAFDPGILPTIDIRKVRFRFAIPDGLATVAAAASLRPGTEGALALQAKLSLAGPQGTAELAYEGTIRLGSAGDVTSSGLLRANAVELASGQVSVKALKIELPMSVALTGAGVTAIVQQGARFEAGVLKIGPNLATGPISGSVTGRLSTNEALSATADITLDAREIHTDSLSAKRLSATLSGRIDPSSALASNKGFSAVGEIAIDVREFRADNLSVKHVTASLPVRVEAGTGNIAIEFSRDAQLSLGDLQNAGKSLAKRLSTAISGRIALSGLSGDMDASAGIAIDHKLSISPGPITIEGPTVIAATLNTIETNGILAADGAYRGRVVIDSVHLIRGDQSVRATGIDARLTSRAGLESLVARIAVGAVQSAPPMPGFGNYAVDATVRQTRAGVSFGANIGGFGIRKLVNIAGLHDLAKGVGDAEISIPDLTLGPSGVWPVSVFKTLKDIRNVTGRLGGDARLAWRNEKFTGKATLRLGGLGGETDDASVEGISGTIALDRLFPLSTAPDQRLRIRKFDAGVVIADTSILFSLLPSGVLRIGRAEAVLADGKVIIVAPVIDLTAETVQATLTLEGIRVERIPGLGNVDGFEATGQIDGTVPIRLTGSKIAIKGGMIAARGGGLLRLKSERAEQVLKTGGEQVALMLQALENFTYENFRIDVDKSLAGDARVKLRTLGHNPAVLNGRKFQINVNLETNLDRLLDATVQWYQLSGRALRNIVRPETSEGTR
jgi:hypothetical protein